MFSTGTLFTKNIIVIAEIFYTHSGFALESNCTGRERKAALRCLQYISLEKVDISIIGVRDCKNITNAVTCFSRLGNKDCFESSVFAERWNLRPNDMLWTDFLENINLCGNLSSQELSQIGCLQGKQFRYPQQCGIMELNDCKKRLESVKCRMKYIQSECNTATAMKICENYIIEGGHCTDVLTQCLNMTFEKDNGLLTKYYRKYIYDYNLDYEYFGNYSRGYNVSKRHSFQLWTIIFIFCFIEQK